MSQSWRTVWAHGVHHGPQQICGGLCRPGWRVISSRLLQLEILLKQATGQTVFHSILHLKIILVCFRNKLKIAYHNLLGTYWVQDATAEQTRGEVDNEADSSIILLPGTHFNLDSSRQELKIPTLTMVSLHKIVFWYGLYLPIEKAKWPSSNPGSLHHCISETVNWGFGSNRIRHRRISCTYKQHILANMALRLTIKSPAEIISSTLSWF